MTRTKYTKKNIIIGSRASQLALIQTEIIKKELQKHFPEVKYEIKKIITKGDKILSVGLSAIGDKGLFTKELEKEILEGTIDFAVHSLKDLPTQLPQGLTIGAVTKRENPADVLISNKKFINLLSGAKVGTSSLRRRSQLKALRPDLDYIDIRGNLNTRLNKLDEGLYDAIILAYAGIKRLGREDRIKEVFDIKDIVPAVSQGALAVECKNDNLELLEMLKVVCDQETNKCITAERMLLKELQGGCQVPIGAYAKYDNSNINIIGFVSDLEGNTIIKDECSSKDPVEAGLNLASRLKDQGADKILTEIIKTARSNKHT